MIKLFWTLSAIEDLKSIASKKIVLEITNSPKTIVFPEQYQIDEYRSDCRRIIIRNYKILYQHQGNSIYIVRVFNTLQNPSNILR